MTITASQAHAFGIPDPYASGVYAPVYGERISFGFHGTWVKADPR